MNHKLTSLTFLLTLTAAAQTGAGTLTIPNSFSSGAPALAAEVNQNFSEIKIEVDDNDTRINELDTKTQSQESRISALETMGSGNVITVAPNGGDFSSVAAAINSIASASADNPYLVKVYPGLYTETDVVQVPGFVHLQGSGRDISIISSSRSDAVPSVSAATVVLEDEAKISDITIRNQGNGDISIAILSTETSVKTIVDNVVAEAIGDGGTGHYAAYWNDAEATIRNSYLYAEGAVGFGTSVNAAFGSVNIANGFPQAVIEYSTLIGGGNNTPANCVDNTGTGFGLQLSNSSPTVRYSKICGGHRGIASFNNGNSIIQNSDVRVSTTNEAFLFEITASGSISVANSGIAYLSNKFTGAGTGLRCVHNYSIGTFAALTNGSTAETACD